MVSFRRFRWDKERQISKTTRSQYGDTLPIQASRQQSNQQATIKESLPVALFWNQVATLEESVRISHGTAGAKSAVKASLWKQAPVKQQHNQSGWDNSIQNRDEQAGDSWKKPPKKDQNQTERYYRVDEYGSTGRQVIEGYTIPQPARLDFHFAGNRYTPLITPSVYFELGFKTPNNAIQPKDSSRQSIYSSNRHNDQPIKLPWGFGNSSRDERYQARYGGETAPEITEKPEPEQPDIRDSYLLMNTITTVTLPDRTPVELNNLSISLDIDSFSWAFQAELWGATSLALVEPDQNGPKQVEVDINGWTWIFIIERYTSNRQLAREQYTIYGTSRTQLLAAPYAPQRSKSSASDLNAKQAIEEELQNTGFTSQLPELNEYTTPDWIIPGGTFSYQNRTPIKVIAQLTSTAGSVIIPARDSDTLSIQPRYPASPWAWDSRHYGQHYPCRHGHQHKRQLEARTPVQRSVCLRHPCRRSREC